jgi:uncharacterized protein (DUF983 family)
VERPNPLLAGAKGRCPNCGEGPLFEGFLKVAPRCSACSFDLAKADSGDGPAVFVILVAGFLVGFTMLVTAISHPELPVWLDLLIFMPLTVVVCLGLLRPFKGVMVALQFANHASQAGGADVAPSATAARPDESREP